MNREQSDGEDGVAETEDGQVDGETVEAEVNFCLPHGSDPRPELMPKDIPIVPGAVGVAVPYQVCPSRGQTEMVHV